MNKYCEDTIKKLADQFISGLQTEGTWRKPWSGSGPRVPTNALTGKPYRGFNYLSLYMTAMQNGWENLWMTWHQKQQIAAACEQELMITKGEHGSPIMRLVKWKPKKNNPDDIEMGAMKVYKVFNVRQLEHIPDYLVPAPEPVAINESVQEIIDRLEININVIDAGTARFVPSMHRIDMPLPQQFKTEQDYYATLLHEMVHWTGVKGRVERDKSDYAIEELVAEIGAAYLCDMFGIEGTDLQHQEYINGWCERITDKPRVIYEATREAQKAVDYLIGEAQ